MHGLIINVSFSFDSSYTENITLAQEFNEGVLDSKTPLNTNENPAKVKQALVDYVNIALRSTKLDIIVTSYFDKRFPKSSIVGWDEATN